MAFKQGPMQRVWGGDVADVVFYSKNMAQDERGYARVHVHGRKIHISEGDNKYWVAFGAGSAQSCFKVSFPCDDRVEGAAKAERRRG